MTGTNRNRKLWLADAWKHYWSVIFPGRLNWQADLEAEIRKRLYHPGESTVFPSGHPCPQPPSWANDLTIRFEGNAATVRCRETDFGNLPLFTDQLIPVLSNWASNNPLSTAGTLPALTSRERERCRDFLIAAVRDCGNAIQNHLLRMLKVPERPEFEIYCRPNGDAFSDEKKIPEFALSEISRIDIPSNALKDRHGGSVFSFVQIKRRRPSETRAGPHGSFEDQDAALVDKMKILIDGGTVPNARQAAQSVLSEAPRRKDSSDDSVLRRLQDRFSKTYPNYSNRRGKPSIER